MKKKVVARFLLCLMIPMCCFFGGCDLGFSNDDTEPNPTLEGMMENLENDPDYYSKFTYTYYDQSGKELRMSAFEETYVFIDPGSDGKYDDVLTGNVVSFADLVSREIGTLSQDITYKLLSVYGGDDVAATKNIKTTIKNYKTGADYPDVLDYEIMLDKPTSLGDFEESEKNAFRSSIGANSIDMSDLFTLSLLNANSEDTEIADNTTFDTLSHIFMFKNVATGYGFEIYLNDEGKTIDRLEGQTVDRKWVSVENTIDVEKIVGILEEEILSIKTGGTKDIYAVEHLGFTKSEIQQIKQAVLNCVIGSGNVNYDEQALACVKSVNIAQQLSLDGSSSRIVGNSDFETVFASYVSGGISAEQLKSDNNYKTYISMLNYKAYNIVVDRIVDMALESVASNAGDPTDLVVKQLYFLYPRIAVMIVPGMYLGGEAEDNVEEGEDVNVDDDTDYDFDEIANTTTVETWLPSWKIISVVYKPDDVYGINTYDTSERIDGVVMTDLDIAFVGEVGYTSVIESHVSYVVNGTEVVDPNTTMLSDELVDDICPDMTDNYEKNHYLNIFDITKVAKDDLSNYVLKKYDGIDFAEEAQSSDTRMTLTKVGMDDSDVYFNRVDGLPYDSTFVMYEENEDGALLLNMDCLGNYYVKIDVSFLNIKDNNNKDVTASVKRTNLGIISLEPHTAS